MLPAHRAELLERVPDGARVLDVGGWAAPLHRADAVIDLMPYATRGLYGTPDPAPERFTAATWVVRDVCAHEPWPFADDAFDFVVCAHTLEDLRDPIRVCEEMSRVAKAGYLEVPSRLEEQAWGVEGPWTGWSHHRWLVDADREAQALTFTFKSHVVHAPGRYLPEGFAATLTPEQRIEWLWWEGSVRASEKVHLGADTLEPYLRDFVAAHAPPPTGWRAQARRRLRR